jgi:hypothetical protein
MRRLFLMGRGLGPKRHVMACVIVTGIVPDPSLQRRLEPISGFTLDRQT